MSDLSQRLRECAETEYDCDQFSPETVSAMKEAADELDRLRAEVEGLKSADANKDWLALVAENKRLRAEVAELKKEAEDGKGLVYFYDKWDDAREKTAILRAENETLRAEIEKLRLMIMPNVYTLANTLSEENDSLRAEVAELRGALRSVLIDAPDVTGQAWEDIREKAHAILAKTAPPKTAPPSKEE